MTWAQACGRSCGHAAVMASAARLISQRTAGSECKERRQQTGQRGGRGDFREAGGGLQALFGRRAVQLPQQGVEQPAAPLLKAVGIVGR